MRQLRLRTIIFTSWLAVFYFFSRYGQSIHLSEYLFLYCLILAGISLVGTRVRKIHLAWLVIVPAILFMGIKALIGDPIVGNALPGTIIEASAIAFTMILLNWMRAALLEFENAVAEISIAKQAQVIATAAEGQSVLYREVRRARNHQRPLSIIAVGLDEKSIFGSVNQLIKEAQQVVLRQLAYANVSRILSEKLEDCDIVVQTNDHFLIILPETKPEDLPALTERLEAQIANQTGVEIITGTASLPHDSLTLDGLIEKATGEMKLKPEAELRLGADQVLVNNKAG